MTSFDAVVTQIAALTPDVRELDLALIAPRDMSFAAGQFVSFEVHAPGWPYPVTRSYSIASDPGERDHITLVLNLVDGGRMSPYLFGLRAGDHVTFRGPLGTFRLHQNGRDVLFVATGTGIAPFRSMLRSLATQKSARRITLVWGVRSRVDLYYQEELARLAALLPAFSSVTTLSRPDEAWDGARGQVTPHVDRLIASVSNLDAYVCGNEAMIRDVTAVLNRKGLCPVYREQYYR